MGNKKFTEILLEFFRDKNDFGKNECLTIEKMIDDFSDNHFFSILSEDEQYAMALIISDRIRLSIENKEFMFTTPRPPIEKDSNKAIKSYVFKYEITNDEVDPLAKLIKTDITTREKQKSFYTDLNEVYERNKFNPWAYTMYPFRDKTDKFIDKFLPESFLDDIPITEREEIIIYIIRFGAGYYKEKDFIRVDTKIKPSVAVKNASNRIQTFQDFIKKFLPEKNTRPLLGGTKTTFHGLIPKNMDYLEDINNRLDVLKLDLKNKEFKIFSKLYYEGSEALDKDDLENFLRTEARKYNLACSDDIRDIRANMPNLK